MNQPILLTVTARDEDATQVCWQIATGDGPLVGCSDITPDEPSQIDVGTVNGPGAISGTIWVVDDLGLRGPATTVQGTVTW